MDLGPVLLGESHVGEDVCFGLVHKLGEPADRRPQLVGHFAPLGSGGIGIILGEGGGDEGRNHAATALAGMGQRIAHEMNPASLPSGVQDFGDGSLQAFMGVGDHQLDPRRVSLRRKLVQKISASDGPISIPRTSRRPSALTPTAMMTATETTRPS